MPWQTISCVHRCVFVQPATGRRAGARRAPLIRSSSRSDDRAGRPTTATRDSEERSRRGEVDCESLKMIDGSRRRQMCAIRLYIAVEVGNPQIGLSHGRARWPPPSGAHLQRRGLVGLYRQDPVAASDANVQRRFCPAPSVAFFQRRSAVELNTVATWRPLAIAWLEHPPIASADMVACDA
jgi:hypothetical protein